MEECEEEPDWVRRSRTGPLAPPAPRSPDGSMAPRGPRSLFDAACGRWDFHQAALSLETRVRYLGLCWQLAVFCLLLSVTHGQDQALPLGAVVVS